VNGWRNLVVRGSLVLMESIWVYALVAFFVAITVGGGKPTFLGVGVVVIGSFAISRWLQSTSMGLGVVRIWGALLSILLFYAVVRIDFFGDFRLWDLTFIDELFNNTEATLEDDATAVIGVPVLWGFWMRGVLRGQQSVGFEDVVRSFAVGVVIVAVAALFAGIDNDMPREVDFVAVPYLAVGLLAIGLAHASRAADEFERPISTSWMLAVGGGVLGLTLFALLFVIVDFDMAQSAVLWVARGVGVVFGLLLYAMVWPMLKLVELSFGLIQALIDLYGGTQQEAQEFPNEPSGEEPQENERGDIVPDWVELLIRVIVAGSLVTGIVLGMALMFARLRKDTRRGGVRESTYQEGRLGSDLSNLLGAMLGRFRPHHATPAQLDEARRLYFEMLSAAEGRGVQRRPMETPLELAPRIGRTFGAQTPDKITEVFDDVRYGHVPPTPSEMQRLREEWERLPK
jgi:hypothetical protein